MPDIFNRNSDVFGGSFASDAATITFPAVIDNGVSQGADVGLLVQQMQTQYQQQVTRLYEVGRPAIYYVGGRTQGDASVERVVGPRSIANAFYTTYGDICRAKTNVLNFALTTGCPGSNETQSQVSYSCFFVVITAIGVGVRAAEMLVNESLRMMFSSFEYSQDS